MNAIQGLQSVSSLPHWGSVAALLVRRPIDPLLAPPADSGESSAGSRLVEEWRRGDGSGREESFRKLFQLFFVKVYRFFVRRGFSPEESKDLAQETFLRVHNKLAGFRGEARFETWLYKIATNIYRNRLRTLATLKRDAQEVAWEDVTESDLTAARRDGRSRTADAEGPLDRVLSDEMIERLYAAMESLPAQMRRCVMLRVEGDMKYREIAYILQVSVDTVKAHLYQARQQLKERLGDYFDDLVY